MTKHFPIIRTSYWSWKPKMGTAYCTVPQCDRSWELEGSSQGFTLAAAESHAYAHWRKFHKEHGHDGVWSMNCQKCAEAYEKGKAEP